MSTLSDARTKPRLGVFHCTLTGAAVLGVVFLLLWASEAVADVAASKALLVFFTGQALDSAGGTARGLVAAVVVGGLLGALISIFFNVFSFIGWQSGEARAKRPEN
jgi:hypothetical protein